MQSSSEREQGRAHGPNGDGIARCKVGSRVHTWAFTPRNRIIIISSKQETGEMVGEGKNKIKNKSKGEKEGGGER